MYLLSVGFFFRTKEAKCPPSSFYNHFYKTSQSLRTAQGVDGLKRRYHSTRVPERAKRLNCSFPWFKAVYGWFFSGNKGNGNHPVSIHLEGLWKQVCCSMIPGPMGRYSKIVSCCGSTRNAMWEKCFLSRKSSL